MKFVFMQTFAFILSDDVCASADIWIVGDSFINKIYNELLGMKKGASSKNTR